VNSTALRLAHELNAEEFAIIVGTSKKDTSFMRRGAIFLSYEGAIPKKKIQARLRLWFVELLEAGLLGYQIAPSS